MSWKSFQNFQALLAATHAKPTQSKQRLSNAVLPRNPQYICMRPDVSKAPSIKYHITVAYASQEDNYWVCGSPTISQAHALLSVIYETSLTVPAILLSMKCASVYLLVVLVCVGQVCSIVFTKCKLTEELQKLNFPRTFIGNCEYFRVKVKQAALTFRFFVEDFG